LLTTNEPSRTLPAPRGKRRARAAALAALVGAVAIAGCNDFLAGGELDTDPNRPGAATNRQLFTGVQSNIWSLLASDAARIAGLLTQQFTGIQSQTLQTYQYSVNEQTTNGIQRGIYAGGGLRDVRLLQENARAQGDTLMLAIAQIQEAILIGTAADLFGDVVYSQALREEPNPPLDEQMTVYDAVLALLGQAINNLNAIRGTATNLGPGNNDLNYGGDREAWTRLAHTIRARFYLHTAERRGTAAYQSALAEARLGLTDPAEDYKAVFSGGASETNFWYQFTVEQRFGYIAGDPQFTSLLESRNDPRLEQYFDVTGDVCGEPFLCLAGDAEGGEDRLDPGYDQPLFTAQENLLIWAEAAQRTGNDAEARTQLNRARDVAELDPVAGTVSGRALLNEILTEKYIALFQSVEVWNDYRRTCTPNLRPTVAGQKISARLLYDAGERQTNTSIPSATEQPTRNDNDPVNATSDGTGAACLGQ
jgi:hypothetical protein